MRASYSLRASSGWIRAGNSSAHPGDFKAQTVQAFENLKAALEAVGANFGHLVKINNYLVDIERNMLAFREVRDRYLVGAAAGQHDHRRPGAGPARRVVRDRGGCCAAGRT